MFISLVKTLFVLVFQSANCDVAYPWQIFFQDPATPTMEGIIHFHDSLMFLIVFITFFVMTFLVDIHRLFSRSRTVEDPKVLISHHTLLEIVWTLIPTILLAGVAFPSFYLLYSFEELIDPTLTLKITGYQWYWNYAISDFENTWFPVHADNVFLTARGSNFDSYMVEHIKHLWVNNPIEKEIIKYPHFATMPARIVYSYFRLLQTDRILYLPVNTHIRLLVTAADVLHSWAVPSFGIKVDACPGRLSQIALFIKRQGVFYGQCSEICGVNHGFMPICVHAVSNVTDAGILYNWENGINYYSYQAPVQQIVDQKCEIGSVFDFSIRKTNIQEHATIDRNLTTTIFGAVFPYYNPEYLDTTDSDFLTDYKLVNEVEMPKNASIFIKSINKN